MVSHRPWGPSKAKPSTVSLAQEELQGGHYTFGGFHFFQQHLGDIVDAPQVFGICLLCPVKGSGRGQASGGKEFHRACPVPLWKHREKGACPGFTRSAGWLVTAHPEAQSPLFSGGDAGITPVISHTGRNSGSHSVARGGSLGSCCIFHSVPQVFFLCSSGAIHSVGLTKIFPGR